MVMENIPMTSIDINHKKDYHSIDYREAYPDVKGLIKRNIERKCNRHLILDRLPFVRWLPKYQVNYLFADFVAGITVGLTAIPQGIAYAVVAGLEPQYGLYAGFAGCFVYFLLGSCKDITIGPTAIMALMVQKYVHTSPDYAVLIAFLSGIIILLFGLLNLGFLIQFISQPVTIGFTSAAAITIGSSQLKSLLGLPGSGNEFIEAWTNIFKNIGETKLWDAVLGVSTVIFLLVLRQLKNVTGRWKVICKYISLSRNALAVFAGTLFAYLLAINDIHPFALTGKIVSGFPPIQPPPFSTVINNQTVGFNDMLADLGPSIIAIPLIAILESVAIAKAFSKGQAVNATQEMIALGMCNIVGSFFLSMPTTGSFTRTAVNNASGVRTQFGGIFTGILILLSLGFLTETFQFIPKTTLAAIIITAMVFMIEYDGIRQIWQTRRLDIGPFLAALIGCLFMGLEYGILIGITLNIVFLLYDTSRPNIDIQMVRCGVRDVMTVTPDQSLIFSSAEYFKYKVLKHSLQQPTVNVAIINGHFIQCIDTTVAKSLQTILEDFRVQKKSIIFWNWKIQPRSVLCRLHRQFNEIMYNSLTLDEVLQNHFKCDDNTALAQS